MITRSLSIFLLLVGAIDPAAGQSTGTVAGKVLDEHGRPLSSAQVVIEGTNRGAVTDSIGAFRLSDVAPGELTILVQIIGYEQDRRRLRLAAGESVQIVFELAQIEIYIPGAGVPLPDAALLAAAQELLPHVLEDSAARRLLASVRAGRNPAILWVPWASDTLKGPDQAPYDIRVACEECSAGRSFTVEGGARYTAGVAHVRVGVMKSRSRGGLTICLDAAPVGRVLMENCFQSGGAVQVSFWRTESGQWIREG